MAVSSRKNGLLRPNVFIGEDRVKTSVSLDPVIWEALREIAAHQGKSVDRLVTEIHRERGHPTGLSAAVRVYVVEFYRERVKL